MKKFYCHVVNNVMLPCLAVAAAALLCLDSGQAIGNDLDSGSRRILHSPQGKSELITSGVYGPFSSYYFPSLSTGDEVCNLMTDDFTVICFPAKNQFGTLLAETDKMETIQAQLFAVNNGLRDRPMPELIINVPLADMDQKFFAKDSIKSLLRVGSIFDEVCEITYQADEQSPKNEQWLCSSFLKHFDKYTGQPRLYYELRIRPVALRPVSNKNAIDDTNRDSFNFFKNLQNVKALSIKVDLLNDKLAADSSLYLSSNGRWINRLLDVYYIDTPTIDASALDELAGQVSNLYSTDEKSKPQDAKDKTGVSEIVYGPFDPISCRVDRYVKHMNNTNNQWIYPDTYLINCNHLKIFAEKHLPWAIQIMIPKVFENLSITEYLEKHAVDVHFRLRDFEPPSFVMISDKSYSLFPITQLTYELSKMPPEFFNSPVIQDTLHSATPVKAPCIISYIADGKQIGKESLYCDLSYQIAYDELYVTINVDYDLKDCFQPENKSCQKAALMKATSFLKEITVKPQELLMKIEFQTGGDIAASLDLSDFELASIDLLLRRIELLH